MNLQPWQKEMLNKVYGGIARGEMMTISAGRQIGKSSVDALIRNMLMMQAEATPYKNAGKAEVDGELWYTVKCSTEVAEWIRTLPKKDNWYEHIDNNWYAYSSMFDLHERVYLQLGLKFA